MLFHCHSLSIYPKKGSTPTILLPSSTSTTNLPKRKETPVGYGGQRGELAPSASILWHWHTLSSINSHWTEHHTLPGYQATWQWLQYIGPWAPCPDGTCQQVYDRHSQSAPL